jgi:hypothetical protein
MDIDRITDIVSAYETYPMQDGDAVLLLVERGVATEIAGLADAWDPRVRCNVAQVLREIDVREVVVGIARRHKVLREGDSRLLTELRQELAETGIVVHRLVALPAA